MRILVNSHDLDTVMRMTFGELSRRSGMEVFIIGPGEAERQQEGLCKGVDAYPVTSKISPKAIRSIRKAVRSLDIDIVFSASTSALSNSLLATKFTKARNVGYRGTQHRIHRSDPFNYLALLNGRVARVVCETEDIRQYLEEFIPAEKLSARPKPYSVEWVKDAMASLQSVDNSASSLRCVYVGITEGRPFKGLSHLLEAMRILQPEGVTLTVIGRASEEDMKAAPSNVTFLGNRKDAIHFLPSHDLFILPSTRDASPRVVREAQACSLPCIVTDIPGARNLIIPGETGLLVPPANAQAIADAVRKISASPELMREMGSAGRRNIIENYAVEPYVDFYYNLFKSIKK